MPTNYEIAKAELGDIEGFYSNDKSDSGGETLYGWARNYHPEIEFWPKLDEYKHKYGGWTEACAAAVKADPYFKQVSDREYKKQYWDIFDGDNLPYSLALEIFESGVNGGVGTVTKMIQRVLNGLNYQNKFGKDLDVDGAFGDNTRKRFKAALTQFGGKVIQYGINGLQTARYLELTEANSARRKFYRGWVANRSEAIYQEKPGDAPAAQMTTTVIPETAAVTNPFTEQDIQNMKMLADTLNTILQKVM